MLYWYCSSPMCTRGLVLLDPVRNSATHTEFGYNLEIARPSCTARSSMTDLFDSSSLGMYTIIVEKVICLCMT